MSETTDARAALVEGLYAFGAAAGAVTIGAHPGVLRDEAEKLADLLAAPPVSAAGEGHGAIESGQWHADTESTFASVDEAVEWFRGVYSASGSLAACGVVAGWPDDPVVVAFTGNGPRAAVHARFIAEAANRLARPAAGSAEREKIAEIVFKAQGRDPLGVADRILAALRGTETQGGAA